MITVDAPIESAVVRRLTILPRGGSARIALAASIIIAGLAVIALCAPLLAPHDPTQGDLSNALAGSSAQHLLGTDQNGRDILSRLIYGGRTALLGPLGVTLLATAIGLPLGLLAGHVGSVVDSVVSRVWDVLLAFPTTVLGILLVAAIGPGYTGAIIAMAIAYVPLMGRMVRGATIVERQKPYVDACRVQGFSTARILFRHVLPAITPLVVAQATLNFGYSLLDLAGLAYLGLGVQPPTADWGQMLNTGQGGLVLGASSEMASAAIAILVAVVSVNLLGDALVNRAEASR